MQCLNNVNAGGILLLFCFGGRDADVLLSRGDPCPKALWCAELLNSIGILGVLNQRSAPTRCGTETFEKVWEGGGH